MYYSDCLQAYLEDIEQLLDSGLGLPDGAGLRFDTRGLMRMDEAAQHTANAQGVGSGVMKINEARATLGLGPVEGGDTPYLQQQNYSLSALAKRDAAGPPPPAGGGAATAPAEENEDDTTDSTEEATSE
jgi:phage portal protein BeeE